MTTKRNTKTSAFGVSTREGHDSTDFYARKIYSNSSGINNQEQVPCEIEKSSDWIDRIYNQSSEEMPIPGNSVGLAFTSPPYNVGKEYDEDLGLDDYLRLIRKIGTEVYRVLKPGGRYVINVANLGRKPYIPITSYFHQIHSEIGFLPMGDIIWQKGKGANGSCAWGSWRSAKAPRLRDLHEYLLVFAKGSFSRDDTGVSEITKEEFMRASLSIWEIPPESAKRIGHPAPFPVSLAERVIKFYSFVDDVVLDPFNGSGTTCVAALQSKRHYVGFDVSPEYCRLAMDRLMKILPISKEKQC